MEYTIVSNVDNDKFSEVVSFMANNGWILLGQPFVKNSTLCQAMIKESENVVEGMA